MPKNSFYAWLCALIAILCLSYPSLGSAAESAPFDLAGIWMSTATFGPELGPGEIVLTNSGGAWSASVDRATATSRDTAEPFTFDFSGGNGLMLRRSGGSELAGQWVQQSTVSTGYRVATPVAFKQDGAGRWRGRIEPIADVQRVELLVRPDSTGALTAFIRNPEQNFGARIGMRTISLDGNKLVLSAKGAADIVGFADPAAGTLHLALGGFPGYFVFHRASTAIDTIPTPYQIPTQTQDGWRTGSLAGAAIDTHAIDGILAQLSAPATSTRSPYIQSLLLARHGKLVLDAYFDGFDRITPHDVRSAGKSVTTLLVGAAIQDGASITPATTVDALFPQYLPFANDEPRKHRMTLADLMTMSTGLACDDNDDNSPGLEDTMQSQQKQPDWYKYTLDLPMVSDPGTKAAYCSATINLLGGVVSKATGRWLPDYFYDRFARPMQFGQYGLWLTPPPLSTAYMAGGDYFLPRDFLKFGQLFLDHGRWNGAQILDDAWLQQSVQPRSSLNGPNDYGYGWHLLTYVVNGQTYRAYNAGGNGGQLLIVIPRLDTAIMITAANYGQYPVWQSFVNDLVPKSILPAIRP